MKKNIIYISIIVFLLLILSGISYAYFATKYIGVESSTSIKATSGEMTITFANGSGVISASNIVPSSSPFATKNFTITGNNATNSEMNYKLKLVVESNSFENNAISYILKVPSGMGLSDVSGSILKFPVNTIEYNLCESSFPNPGIYTHSYTLYLYFLDNGTDQSANMSGRIKAHIEIIENVNNEITFKIDGTTYTALDGMNWTTWVSSNYNTAGLTVSNVSELIIHNNYDVLQYCANSVCRDVSKRDGIIENGNYHIDS